MVAHGAFASMVFGWIKIWRSSTQNSLCRKVTRLIQAHIDFLLMNALILGFYAAKVPLVWHVRWTMVICAFTNSSLFLLIAVFPALDNPKAPPPELFNYYLFASRITTSYGFGKASVLVIKSTFETSND
jgi:hypothetical protein